MASGGVRTNIGAGDNFTPGEDRTGRWAVVDANDDAETDFTGWTFAWYLVRSLDTAQGVTKLAARALITKTSGDGIDSSTEPNVDVTIDAADSVELAPGTYAYELWRTDSGNVRRLAYGSMVWGA